LLHVLTFAFAFQLGVYNSLVWTLLMYGVRYLGYSYTNCAWYAFPFEALEVFTFALLQVATAKFVKDNAPPGALATLTGITGGAHFGFGKGVGGLVGGVIIEVTKSTKMAFYYFGLFSFGCGGFYGIFVGIFKIFRIKGIIKTSPRVVDREEEEKEEEKTEPFLARGAGDGNGVEGDENIKP